MNDYKERPRCPHCKRILQVPFLVKKFNYLVCDGCVNAYASVDPWHFDTCRLSCPITTELLCNTSQFQEFTSSYPQYSLRALLEKKIIRMMYTGAADDETLCLPIERTKDPVCETGHFISTIGGKLSQLKSSIQGKVEQLKEHARDAVAAPEVRLHFSINKYRMEEKLGQLKQSSSRLADGCLEQLSTLKEKCGEKSHQLVGTIRSVSEELPSWSELKKALPESLSNIKSGIFSRLFK